MHNNNDLLTKAEKAAAEALARHWNLHVDTSSNMKAADFADDARAVVAAVRPILKAEADTTTENED